MGSRAQIGKAGEALEDRFSIMVFVAERSPEGSIVQTAQNTDIILGMETNAVRDGTMGPVDYRSR
ncbi:MAG: hypothetical protein ACJAZ1_002719 [Yoonia sp.]|jgi:hypothetical protein